MVALPKYQISRLQRIMNISARLIFQKPRDHSVTELLVKLHWLKVKDRIVFKILSSTWQSLNKVAPPYIVDIVTPNVPKRALRSVTNCDLYVPKSRTRYGDRTFSYGRSKVMELDTSFRPKTIFITSVLNGSLKHFYLEINILLIVAPRIGNMRVINDS